MPNLKEVRNRISSVNSTMQITSAMKMVSAAKLRKAQDAIVKMRPYASKLQEILSNLSTGLDTSENMYAIDRAEDNVLVVAITSNRGLCGGFNSNIIKRVNSLLKNELKDKRATVICAGKKAYDYYRKTEFNIKGSGLPRHMNHLYDDLSYENVSEQAEKIMAAFAGKQFYEVHLVYNSFKNAATQELKVEQFLPIVPPEAQGSTSTDYIFEPSKEEIINDLIPRSLKTQFYKALLDSYAAEHGARMTAMHKATDNASELLHDLRLSYNKARQAAITTEILEIVGGAEALAN